MSTQSGCLSVQRLVHGEAEAKSALPANSNLKPFLSQGEHYGQVRRQLRAPHLSLSDVMYPPGTKHDKHGNADALLVFVKSGGYQKQVGNFSMVCKAGDVVFIPAQQAQADRFGNARTHCYIASCTPTLIEKLEGDGFSLPEAVCLSGSRSSRSTSTLQSELLHPDAFSNLLIEGIVLEILVHEFRASQERHHVGTPPWLTRAREMLHDDTSKVVSLGSVAKQIGVAPATLSAGFRHYYGCSPGEYLRRLRVEHAADLLKRTETPIAQVSAICGFSDQAHMTRLFQSLLACSPARYRRSFRGEERSKYEVRSRT